MNICPDCLSPSRHSPFRRALIDPPMSLIATPPPIRPTNPFLHCTCHPCVHFLFQQCLRPLRKLKQLLQIPLCKRKGIFPPNRYPFVLFPGVYGKNYGHRLSKYLGKWVDPQYLVSSMIKNHNCWKLYSTASQAGTHVDDWEPEPGFSSSSQPRFIYLCSPLVHLRRSLSLSLFLLRRRPD